MTDHMDPTASGITLNVNGLNITVKRLPEWVKMQYPTMFSTRNLL